MKQTIRVFCLLFAISLAACGSGDPESNDSPDNVVAGDTGVDTAGAVDMGVDLGEPPPAGVVNLSPTMVTLSESGTADVEVSLEVEPQFDVRVEWEVSDDSELVVSNAITFTTEDWATPRTVTLRGVDNACFDGSRTVEVTARISSMGNYAAVEPLSLTATVTDDDQPSGSVTPRAISAVEGGAIASFDVVLSTDCITGPVTIPLSVSEDAELQLDVDELVFATPEEAVTPQRVSVTAVDDDIVESDEQHTVILGAAMGGGYDGVDLDDVDVTIIDDDQPSAVVTPSVVTTSESGTSDTFEVSLAAAPAMPVGVDVVNPAPDEGMVSPTQLMFDGTNFDVPQTVTVTGVDDDICADGAQTYQLELVGSSSDPTWDQVVLGTVGVTNADNDGADVLVTPTLLAIEEGMSDSFTVALSCSPAETITVDVSLAAPDVVSPAVLTFDDTNFGTPQMVTVSPFDDTMGQGDRVVTVVTTVNATGVYAGVIADDVAVMILDND